MNRMDWKKPLIALAVGVALYVAWRSYRWAGLALAITALVMWALLHINRTLAVLRRAAKRPVGHVASAVMLHSKLAPGQTLLHVLALTRSLGQQLSPPDAQPEVYAWCDSGGSAVRCSFARGKLTEWTMTRPPEPQAPVASPAQGHPPPKIPPTDRPLSDTPT